MRDLERRVRLAKANVENMCTLMAGWSKSPLYKRKGDKKESLLSLEVIYKSICSIQLTVRFLVPFRIVRLTVKHVINA